DDLSGPPVLKVIGERLWVDLGYALRSDFGRHLVEFALSRMEARSVPVMRALLDHPAFVAHRTPRFQFGRAIGRLVMQVRAPLVFLRALLFPARGRAAAQAAIRRGLAFGDVPSGAGPKEKLDALVRLLRDGAPRTLATVAPNAGIGMGGIL